MHKRVKHKTVRHPYCLFHTRHLFCPHFLTFRVTIWLQKIGNVKSLPKFLCMKFSNIQKETFVYLSFVLFFEILQIIKNFFSWIFVKSKFKICCYFWRTIWVTNFNEINKFKIIFISHLSFNSTGTYQPLCSTSWGESHKSTKSRRKSFELLHNIKVAVPYFFSSLLKVS